MNRTKAGIPLSSIVALGFSVVLLIAAATMAWWVHSMQENATFNPSPLSASTEQGSTSNEADPFPAVDWNYWKSINPDVVGWITVEGTPINYPILQAHASDSDFYLHHDVYGNWSVYGIPYLDAENETSGLFGSKNAVVFGHHMNDGTMFAAFADYSDKSYANDHCTVLVQTPTEKKKYKVRYVNIINGNKALKRTFFLDDDDYTNWYKDQLSDAVVVLDDKTTPESTITFCTCSYNYFGNERTLVLASEESSN